MVIFIYELAEESRLAHSVIHILGRPKPKLHMRPHKPSGLLSFRLNGDFVDAYSKQTTVKADQEGWRGKFASTSLSLGWLDFAAQSATRLGWVMNLTLISLKENSEMTSWKGDSILWSQ